MATSLGDSSGDKSPVGVNEVLAIGLGVAALLRIRRRRKKAREEARRREDEAHEEEGTDRQSA